MWNKRYTELDFLNDRISVVEMEIEIKLEARERAKEAQKAAADTIKRTKDARIKLDKLEEALANLGE